MLNKFVELENEQVRIRPRNKANLQVHDKLFLITERMLGFHRLSIQWERGKPIDGQSIAPLLAQGRRWS